MPKAVSSDSPERFEGHIPPGALLNAFETNNRINLYLIENLPAGAWSAKPVVGKGRTIAAILAHNNQEPDRLAAEAALTELAGAGKVRRSALGSDALWQIA